MDSENKLKDIFIRLFGAEPISLTNGSNQNMVEGWDSMGHVLLIGEIERDFNVRLTLDDMTNMTSFGNIKQILQRYNVW